MRNTETVIGIVVYAGTAHKINTIHYADKDMNISLCTMGNVFCVCAGHETKAMQNNSGPRYKRSKLERKLNMDIIWSVVLLLLMCLTAAVGRNARTRTHTLTLALLSLWGHTDAMRSLAVFPNLKHHTKMPNSHLNLIIT